MKKYKTILVLLVIVGLITVVLQYSGVNLLTSIVPPKAIVSVNDIELAYEFEQQPGDISSRYMDIELPYIEDDNLFHRLRIYYPSNSVTRAFEMQGPKNGVQIENLPHSVHVDIYSEPFLAKQSFPLILGGVVGEREEFWQFNIIWFTPEEE